MRGTSTSLLVCAALLLCWPALAFAQMVPDPNAPPHSDAPPAAQAPDEAQEPAPEAAPQPDAAQMPDTPPPPPANFKNPIPADQLAFLRDYADKSLKEIQKDKRFKNLEKQITPSARYFYHYDKSLSEARDEVLNNEPLPVTVRDDRYVMVSSAGGGDQHALGRGFLWFDMQTGIGLGGIYFHPTNGEPSPTLAVFSKQLTDTDLSMGQLPPEFYEDFGQWAQVARVEFISPRYFIPDTDKKYVLLHDEDFCAHPSGEPAPEGCDDMNAQAADVDMNAAYFMNDTHNATDATAYMLNSDQMAWLAVRDRTCRGPNGVTCRIRVTRDRTAVLTGHPVPPPRRSPQPVRR
ncbi:MAG: lysozyme inhibitor LprI family protein [Terracidiphilus sp.]